MSSLHPAWLRRGMCMCVCTPYDFIQWRAYATACGRPKSEVGRNDARCCPGEQNERAPCGHWSASLSPMSCSGLASIYPSPVQKSPSARRNQKSEKSESRILSTVHTHKIHFFHPNASAIMPQTPSSSGRSHSIVFIFRYHCRISTSDRLFDKRRG